LTPPKTWLDRDIPSLLASEVDPETDPLGEGNKLIFAPGLLAGIVFDVPEEEIDTINAI
jgi:hypothetical protein